jgi:DNA polymerase I-like protein with 3'-5' exonuclease and polymerase domains
MTILTTDYETYYDKDFSLSKVTKEQYIRDPRFEVIGLSVQVDDGKPEWFSGTKKQTRDWMHQFPWETSVGVAHNAAFDMAIKSWEFDIKPKRIVDTLSMARAIHGNTMSLSLANLAEYYELGQKGFEVNDAKGKRRLDFTKDELRAYGGYCCNDTSLTYNLFRKLAVGFPRLELELIDLTIRMFTEPVLKLDAASLREHLTLVRDEKERLVKRSMLTTESLRSNPKFAEVLTDLGVTVPMKVSPTTGKETYAFAKTDEALKALLEHPNKLVQFVVAARLGAKSTLEETRTERLIGIAERGLFPVPLRYYAAHTGRWGGDDKVNLQNLPRDSPMKGAIEAPEGYVMVDCDSSQIEARVLAWLARQDDLVQAFRDKEDVYRIMASSIYDKPTAEISQHPERFVGKTTILGAGYGMGGPRFHDQLKNFGVVLPVDECASIIQIYRNTYPNIPQLWWDTGDALEAMITGASGYIGPNDVVHAIDGGFTLPNGLRIHYPDLRFQESEDAYSGKEMVYSDKKGRTKITKRVYGGKAVENICQALARIIIGQQMVAISKRYRVALTVHDSVVALVPKSESAEGTAFIEECMRKPPTWAPDLPLDCESKVGITYG